MTIAAASPLTGEGGRFAFAIAATCFRGYR